MACDVRLLQYLSPLPANSPRREQFVCSSCTTYDIAALIQFFSTTAYLPLLPSTATSKPHKAIIPLNKI
jgi:hypothetical protein